MLTIFHNAEQAFEYHYQKINLVGEVTKTTKRLLNIGFYIKNPLDRLISTPFRNWKESYAKKEYDWYISGDRNVKELAKSARIWNNMHNGDFIVNSNYGYQWNRYDQLNKIIQLLRRNRETRQATVTIYDGKEFDQYTYDTPCTISISFNITNSLLNMTILMRSNDLWYGFCNDQYCFSRLQERVAGELGLNPGWYYHFAQDLHIYNDMLNKS